MMYYLLLIGFLIETCISDTPSVGGDMSNKTYGSTEHEYDSYGENNSTYEDDLPEYHHSSNYNDTYTHVDKSHENESGPDGYKISYKNDEEDYDDSHDSKSDEYSKDSSGSSEGSAGHPHNHYCPPCLVWKSCGRPCEQECHPTTRKCRCRPGCFCPGNLKLNNDGRCVSPHLCPRNKHTTCCFGKMYTTCGSDCVESCDSDVCTKECTEGCFCLRGTKNIDGVCQPPYKCRKCTGGRVYQKCGKRCDEICGCTERQFPTRYCEEGCFCPKGQKVVRGICRPEEECRHNFYPFYK